MDAIPYILIQGEARDVIFESPHHGREVPLSFRHHARLAEAASSRWDNHIDIAQEYLLQAAGGVLLASRISRLVVDLNRGADRVDARVCPRWPGARVHEDGGVIVPFTRMRQRLVSLYDFPLDPEEVEKRLRQYWFPYHDALRKRVEEAVTRYGEAVLISLHSTSLQPAREPGRRPVIYLGTDEGRSCDPAIIYTVRSILERRGCRVITQGYYQGAFVTQAYGKEPRVQAVQIELDRQFLSDPDEARRMMLEPLASAVRAVTVSGRIPLPAPRSHRVPTQRAYVDPLTGEVWRW